MAGWDEVMTSLKKSQYKNLEPAERWRQRFYRQVREPCWLSPWADPSDRWHGGNCSIGWRNGRAWRLLQSLFIGAAVAFSQRILKKLMKNIWPWIIVFFLVCGLPAVLVCKIPASSTTVQLLFSTWATSRGKQGSKTEIQSSGRQCLRIT